MAIAALIAWVLTASIGAYMLHTWVARGGLRRQRATGVGVPPAVVFGHASAAAGGLLIWLLFIGTRLDLLAAPALPRPRLKLVSLIPVAHGFAALTTFMLAVLAAISAR